MQMRDGIRPALALALMAVAGTTAARAADGNDEIIVTATKQAKPVRADDVAQAVDGFDREALDKRQVRSLQDLTYAVPNVALDDIGTFRGTANFSIRGLGINSSIASVDPAVGTFVDGVYLGINSGAALDLADLAGVEVLRGPQGVLFGRNVTGGAIMVNTVDPTPEWRADLRASGEVPVGADRGDGMARGQVTLNAPLGDKGAALRLGLAGSTDGGYFRNLKDGSTLGAANTWIARAGLLLPLGDVKLTIKAEHLDTNGQGAVGQNHGWFARDTFDVSLDTPGSIDGKSDFVVARADYGLGGGTLTNVLGWRKYRQFTTNDIDSTPDFLFDSDTATTQQQWSDELRWAGDLGPLETTLGAYWFRQNVAYQENRRFPSSPYAYGGGRERQEQVALFGQTGFDLTQHLKAVGGLRWSRETKRADVTFVSTRDACSVLDGSCPIDGTNPSVAGQPNGFRDHHAWSNWSPKLALEWRPREGQLAYLSWNRAWRSGGYNLRITQPAAFLANAAATGTPSYGAERVDSYELGAKLADPAGVVAFEIAAYHTYVRNMQREVSVASATAGLSQSIYNTADAEITGGELTTRFHPGHGLELAVNTGVISAHYTHVKYDISGDGVIDDTDRLLDLPRAPKVTYGASAGWTGGAWNARVDYQHRARQAYTDSNFGWLPATDNLDASLAWQVRRTVTLTLYGRNLLDQVQFGGDTQLGFASGPLSNGISRPYAANPATGTFSPLMKGRRIGLELRAGF